MLRTIDEGLIKILKRQAQESDRKRTIYRFHKLRESVQRMINVLHKSTYVRPHVHLTPPKVEVFIALSGKGYLVEFFKGGKVKDVKLLDASGVVKGAEVKPGTYHTLIPLSEYLVVYEVKEGPYDSRKDKVFGEFAPEEGSGGVGEYLDELKRSASDFKIVK